MNYFAHGRLWLDDPWLVAGAAAPDWLGAVNRKARLRRQAAAGFVADPDARVAALARGVLRHHHDDAWFHASRAFVELNFEFTAALRALVGVDDTMRLAFAGHVLVETLLDDALAAAAPGALDRYYAALESIDAEFAAAALERLAGRPCEGLADFIRGFVRARFLFDYRDDAKLLWRLNRVLERVTLPPLPASVLAFLPQARSRVGARLAELVDEPPAPSPTPAEGSFPGDTP